MQQLRQPAHTTALEPWQPFQALLRDLSAKLGQRFQRPMVRLLCGGGVRAVRSGECSRCFGVP